MDYLDMLRATARRNLEMRRRRGQGWTLRRLAEYYGISVARAGKITGTKGKR
jgi:hypothetical protein